MKPDDWNLPTSFRSREARERIDYIKTSLQSAKMLSDRLSGLSSGGDPRSRLCAMRFHKQWRHPDCPVMKWYGLQTSAKFKSIQHWRNLDTQFFHEFLIVRLNDGSAYRVERMGEGSRTDAIRRTGCTAYDLIQWFSPENHTAEPWLGGTNEMIIQVDFPCTFDLLDILAVCYTIQHKSSRASVYTLQRYNCYFLCNTILAVLARRVAAWETIITDTDRPALVLDIINQLKDRSQALLHEGTAVDFLALGICSLLESKDPSSPANFLLEAYQKTLEWNIQNVLNINLAGCLWHKNIDLAILTTISEEDMGATLRRHMSDVPNPIPAASEFITLIKDESDNKEQYAIQQSDLSWIQNVVSEEFLYMWSSTIKNVVMGMNEVRRMRELEDKSFKRRLAAAMIGSVGSVSMSVAGYLLPITVRSLKGDSEIDRWCRRFGGG